uniref:Uncharacterized protein n=1 Tax=Arundo donax TaxID=35708 RepID=A0A0A9ELU5_ARUDO
MRCQRRSRPSWETLRSNPNALRPTTKRRIQSSLTMVKPMCSLVVFLPELPVVSSHRHVSAVARFPMQCYVGCVFYPHCCMVDPILNPFP